MGIVWQKKRPVRKVPRGGPADAGKGAAGEDSPASGGEATGKGKAAMFANIHGARAAIKAAASSSSHPVDSGKTESPAAANNGPSKSELVDESPMDGETPGEQQGRQRSTYLDDVASLDPTLYDMNGLPYRNLNKVRGCCPLADRLQDYGAGGMEGRRVRGGAPSPTLLGPEPQRSLRNPGQGRDIRAFQIIEEPPTAQRRQGSE